MDYEKSVFITMGLLDAVDNIPDDRNVQVFVTGFTHMNKR